MQGITGISTGLRDLDERLNGLQRGEFTILAGRPGMGKSGLVISALRQTAQDGTNALLFSLEMSAESVSDRMLSDACFHSAVRGSLFRYSARQGFDGTGGEGRRCKTVP